MSEIKLIATDLDGTLLDDEKNISEDKLRSIYYLIDKGVSFAFSTGRPYITTKPYFDLIDRDIPLILNNGGLIQMSRSKKVLYKNPLGYENLMKLYNAFKGKCTFGIWSEDNLYFDRLDEFSDWYIGKLKIKPVKVDLTTLKDKEVMKVILLGNHDDLEVLRQEGKNSFNDIDLYFSQNKLLECVKDGVNKGRGIIMLKEALDINGLSMALGDEENDITMFDYADIKVSPSNANIKLKDRADYVGVSNNENLIEDIIKKYKI